MRVFVAVMAVCLGIAVLSAGQENQVDPKAPVSSRHWGEGASPGTADEAPVEESLTPHLQLERQEVDPRTGIELRTEQDVNIFDQIQIELLDLQQMAEDIRSRLVGEEIRLTVGDCVRTALEFNDDILIAQFEPLKTGADLMAAWGDFDPELFASGRFSDSSQPASPQEGVFGGLTGSIDRRLGAYELGLRGLVPTGTQYQVDYSLNREAGTFVQEQIGPMEFQSASEYSGGFNLSLTQPFLRGIGYDVNMVRIRTTRNLVGVAEAQLELTILTSIGEVIKAYWDLVGAIETLRVREEAVANAMRLVDINEQRLEIGAGAAIDVLQAKAGAAARQSDLVTAATAIRDAEDLLKRLIGLQDPGRDLFSSRSVIPAERPGLPEYDWDLDRSMRYSIRYRPDVRIAHLDIENAELELDQTHNALLPQLDGTVSYGQNARTFDVGDTHTGIRDRDGRTWSVGLVGSIPIGNRAARGAHRRAKLTARQLEQQLAAVERDVQLDVRIALRAVAENQALVESNEQTRILQEGNVAAEERRLRLGVSTSQDVLDIQEDLTDAQVQEVQAQVNFEKSLVDLHVAEGTLLRRMGIVFELEDPEDLTGP